MKFFSLSGVTRWLLMVVIGCAALEAAQPMNAAGEPDQGRDAGTVIFPAGGKTGAAPAPSMAPGNGTWLFAAIVCLGAAGFLYWRKRHAFVPAGGKAGLVVEETKALGNRQFLVVAACGGRRFLLGVAPGSIRMLAPLDDKEAADARASD